MHRSIALPAIALLASLLLGVSACGGAAPHSAANPPSKLDTNGASSAATKGIPTMALDAALAREAEGDLSSFPVQPANSPIRATVRAKALPVVEEKTADNGTPLTALTIPIGADSPATCIIRDGRMGAAQMAHGLLTQIAANNTKLTLRRLDIDVLALGDAPALFVDAPFSFDQNGKEAFTVVKVAVVSRDFATLLCMHEQVGYRKTFRRVVESLGTSLHTGADIAKPTYTTITVDKIGNEVVGYSEYHVFSGSGETRIESVIMASLIPREGRRMFFDHVEVLQTDRSGELVESNLEFLANGKKVADAKLKRLRAKEYSVDGTYDEQAVKATFSSKTPIETTLSRRRKFAALKPGNSMSYVFYNGTRNAKGVTQTHVSRGNGKQATFTEEDGTRTTCDLDADGLCERSETSTKEFGVVTSKRIFRAGKL